jgi:tetratricopeptide (TPR) repeat protein
MRYDLPEGEDAVKLAMDKIHDTALAWAERKQSFSALRDHFFNEKLFVQLTELSVEWGREIFQNEGANAGIAFLQDTVKKNPAPFRAQLLRALLLLHLNAGEIVIATRVFYDYLDYLLERKRYHLIQTEIDVLGHGLGGEKELNLYRMRALAGMNDIKNLSPALEILFKKDIESVSTENDPIVEAMASVCAKQISIAHRDDTVWDIILLGTLRALRSSSGLSEGLFVFEAAPSLVAVLAENFFFALGIGPGKARRPLLLLEFFILIPDKPMALHIRDWFLRNNPETLNLPRGRALVARLPGLPEVSALEKMIASKEAWRHSDLSLSEKERILELEEKFRQGTGLGAKQDVLRAIEQIKSDHTYVLSYKLEKEGPANSEKIYANLIEEISKFSGFAESKKESEEFVREKAAFLTFFEMAPFEGYRSLYADLVVAFNSMEMIDVSLKILERARDSMNATEIGGSIDDFGNWMYLKAVTLDRAGFHDKAIALVDEFLAGAKKLSVDPCFEHLQAEIHENAGDKKSALEKYSKICAVFPDYRNVKERIKKLEES